MRLATGWAWRVFGLAVMLTGSMASGAAAADEVSWPQWRGPRRDAVSPDKGLLPSWPENGPPLAYEAKGLGRGFASVVIDAGNLFTAGKLDDGEYLQARRLDNGELIWKARIAEAGDGPSSTPTIDRDRVFAVGSQGDLICANVADGKVLWRKSYTKDFGGSVPTWQYCDSILVDGDKVIATPGSAQHTMVALDRNTGDLIWTTAIPNGAGSGFGYASPVISEGAKVRQYVQLLGAGVGVVGVRASDGKLLWQYQKVANGTASIPTPIIAGDKVFCSSGYGTGSVLLKLSPEADGVKAEEQYFLKASSLENHHGGMVRLGDYVYCGHKHNEGFPICVEISTGKTVWGGNMRGPGSGSAAIVYADGRLYFRYQNGLIALIDSATDGYQVKGTFTLPKVDGPSWSHPVVIGGRLYLREQDTLFVYDVKAK
jgi:outer membrane protein assembly factor BamB